MGILIDSSIPETDSSGVWQPLIEALAHIAAHGAGDASSGIGAGVGKAFEAFRNYRLPKPTRKQLAWQLWCESLEPTLKMFFETAGLTRRPDDAEIRLLIGHLLYASKVQLGEGDVVLAKENLINRRCDFPLYQRLRESLPIWVRHVDRERDGENDRDIEDLKRRLDRAYQHAFYEVMFDGDAYYNELLDYLCGVGSEAMERWSHWQRYYEWLRREVEARPLFGYEDGGPSLADIFVPLRCTWQERPSARLDTGRDETARRNTKVHVRDLKSALNEWLGEGSRVDPLRIVTGGPGCGKSSTAKMFARDVAFAGHYNVFVIPLQGLDVGQDMRSIVDAYVDDASLGGDCLPENPIGWVRDDTKPLLLVFDGLDEVARPDGEGLAVTRRFLGGLHSWLRTVNTGDKAKFMALALGRPQAAEESAKEINGLTGRPLLYVEPLCALDQGHLRRGINGPIEIDDPKALATKDQRQRFWDGYARFDRRYDGQEAAVLEEGALDDLTIEPLLLYLLMYSGLAGEDWQKARDNRNYIYEAIFQRVHQRDVDKKASVSPEKETFVTKEGIDERDFFKLMECLGLAAWLGGGRTGSEADYRKIRDEIYVPEDRARFGTLRSAELKNVAVQFYTHHGGQGQDGYAFIHKSFGEYLAARALIEASEKWLPIYKDVPEDFAKRWLQLTGQQEQSRDMAQFLSDEARLRMTDPGTGRVDRDGARKRVADLVTIVNETLRKGFPAHGALTLTRPPNNWRECERLQRNAEEGLYDLVGVWAEVGYPPELLNMDSEEGGWTPGAIKFNWPDEKAAAGILRRIDEERKGRNYTRLNFTAWDLSGQHLHSLDLRALKLFGANLERANLREANLREANLAGANLRFTSCNRLNIDTARLDFVDLTDAVSLTQQQIDQAYGNSETKLPGGMVRPAHWSGDS